MKEQNQNEVSVHATIKESGLSVGAKSRAISALDRLLGGLLGIPAAWLERIEARIRNQTYRESIIQKAAADKWAGAILNDEEVSRVVTEIALGSSLVSTVNKMQVAEIAINELLQNNVDEGNTGEQEEEQEISEDWLNHFSSYAEKASSEGVRTLWARVLAGQIRKNGSFSLTSLRLLSELDQTMATMFEKEVKYRIENTFILKPKIEELTGARLKSLLYLEEVGLLHSADPIGGVQQTINPGKDGKGMLREQDLLLIVGIHEKLQFKVVLLTQAGREIASILTPADPVEVLMNVGRIIEGKVNSMEIHRIRSKTTDGYITDLVKTLMPMQG